MNGKYYCTLNQEMTSNMLVSKCGVLNFENIIAKHVTLTLIAIVNK